MVKTLPDKNMAGFAAWMDICCFVKFYSVLNCANETQLFIFYVKSENRSVLIMKCEKHAFYHFTV